MKHVNLIRIRKNKEYTCENMAKMLGISTSYYSQIENGNRKLDYKMAVKIASIFKLYPDDIFYRYYERYKVIPNHPKKIKVISYFNFEEENL